MATIEGALLAIENCMRGIYKQTRDSQLESVTQAVVEMFTVHNKLRRALGFGEKDIPRLETTADKMRSRMLAEESVRAERTRLRAENELNKMREESERRIAEAKRKLAEADAKVEAIEKDSSELVEWKGEGLPEERR